MCKIYEKEKIKKTKFCYSDCTFAICKIFVIPKNSTTGKENDMLKIFLVQTYYLKYIKKKNEIAQATNFCMTTLFFLKSSGIGGLFQSRALEIANKEQLEGFYDIIFIH